MPMPTWLCSERMTVEVRHLRGFLAIADERNLTRAAGHLHLSQPALSRTLAQLERDLGVQLVDRSTHHLHLTEAGVRFERSARAAVQAFDDALAGAAGRPAPLRIGQNWSATAYLSPILRAWRTAHPEGPVEVVRVEDRTAGLADGSVDVALTRGPLPDDGYRSVVIDHESRVAVLPAEHPLAQRDELCLDDLADDALVLATRAGTTTAELWPPARRPRVVADASSIDDWMVAIASGLGFGVSVSSTAALHPHPEIRYVPLSDAAPVPLLVAWPRRGAHPSVAEFVRIAREVGAGRAAAVSD